MRYLAPPMMAVDRGVGGERNPETARKRVYDQMADAGRQEKVRGMVSKQLD